MPVLGQQRAFGALFAAVDRGFPGGLAAAWRLDDAPVDGQFSRSSRRCGRRRPGTAAPSWRRPRRRSTRRAGADRGGRAGGVGDLVVGGAQHQHLHELVEHDPVRDPRPVAAQRMGDLALGKQRGELVPQGVDDTKMATRRHEHLVGKNGRQIPLHSTEARACPASPTRPYPRDLFRAGPRRAAREGRRRPPGGRGPASSRAARRSAGRARSAGRSGRGGGPPRPGWSRAGAGRTRR